MKISSAAATILFLEAWSSNKNLAFAVNENAVTTVTCPDSSSRDATFNGTDACSFKNVDDFALCQWSVKDCNTFSIGKLAAEQTITFEGDSLTKFEFETLTLNGRVKACQTKNLKVTGSDVNLGSFIITGPGAVFDIGSFSTGGRAVSYATEAECTADKADEGDSAAATASALGIIMTTTVAVATALFV